MEQRDIRHLLTSHEEGEGSFHPIQAWEFLGFCDEPGEEFDLLEISFQGVELLRWTCGLQFSGRDL